MPLPNFLIIGAEKAATTWLARCLSEHPAVYMPREKEIFYFSKRYERGLDWYETHFKDWAGETRLGEATPVYLSYPEAAERIRTTLGEIELIVSLREPVDRAYSAYWHNLRRGRISQKTDFVTSFLADDYEIRTRGDYLTHLLRYLRCFPRDRLLLLFYEQMQDDGANAIRQSLEFLGLDPSFIPRALETRLNEGGKDVRIFNSAARAARARMRGAALWAMDHRLVSRHAERRIIPAAQRTFERLAYGWGPRARSYEPLSAELRAELLRTHYLAQIKELEELIETDLSRWYESSG